MLPTFPLTIDNIVKCCPCAQLLQLLKILIVTVRMSVYDGPVSWCVKIGTLKRVNTLVRCPRSVAHAILTTFEKFPHLLGRFRSILDVAAP